MTQKIHFLLLVHMVSPVDPYSIFVRKMVLTKCRIERNLEDFIVIILKGSARSVFTELVDHSWVYSVVCDNKCIGWHKLGKAKLMQSSTKRDFIQTVYTVPWQKANLQNIQCILSASRTAMEIYSLTYVLLYFNCLSNKSRLTDPPCYSSSESWEQGCQVSVTKPVQFSIRNTPKLINPNNILNYGKDK